jgi:metallophosphoesterase superfamily enzyme
MQVVGHDHPAVQINGREMVGYGEQALCCSPTQIGIIEEACPLVGAYRDEVCTVLGVVVSLQADQATPAYFIERGHDTQSRAASPAFSQWLPGVCLQR